MKVISGNGSLLSLVDIYRKIPNISHGLIEVRRHFSGGLCSGLVIFGWGLYSEGILCYCPSIKTSKFIVIYRD